ncbi:hypothetical protein GGI12_003463 [Dipsacomyces acuminosporus]|nr:hypothetical protein GGI12_003463 [Dipsacomyces acuminosporus]
MRVGGPLIVKFKRPVEFYESIVMMVVGLIGTFTEHNFFQQPKDGSDQWSHKDLQHTVIGVSWLAGGLLGVLMTWRSQPRERSAIPSIIFIATGISMIIHQQDLVMSSRVHFLFGASLVLLGLSTIVEITLIASNYVKEFGEPEFFQYVPLLFMTSSGMFLMGANRDMVLFLINSQLDIATYALLLLSFCFVILLYFYLLVDLYFTLGGTRVQQTAKYHQLTSNGENDEHLPAGRRTRHSTSSQTSTLNHSENGDVPREELSPQSFAV